MTVAEQMVIEKVEMAPGESIDFGECLVDALRVKSATALEECVLVAEVAVLRTAAGDDDGIGDEIRSAANEIATDGRDALKRAPRSRGVDGLCCSGAEVLKELRKGLISRAEKDGVG